MATPIDKSKPVLVTGANGYVASVLVKRLLDEGITVHAAVRNPDNDKKISHLKQAAADSKGEIRFFKADLLEPGSYGEAMQGCELVYHTASPFTANAVENPQRDLIDPAVNGTANVLKTASETPSVRRVVVTSSCAAIYGDVIDCEKAPNGVLTEEVWNTSSSLDHQAYSYSKTLAEKKAWELADAQSQWDLVTINPSLVVGPPLNATSVTSGTFELLVQMGDGTMKMGAPKMGIGCVDVRDVAEAHFQAGYNPEAKGRYITSAHNSDLLEIAQSLLPKYGDTYPIPKRALPKWLLMIVGPIVNKAFTRKMLRANINIPFRADNSKIKRELGIQFRPMQESMEETFETLIQAGVFNKKK